MQFKLEHRLARLLGIHTQTRPFIVNALWQYIKTHKLQDSSEREYINCDKYFEQVMVFNNDLFIMILKECLLAIVAEGLNDKLEFWDAKIGVRHLWLDEDETSSN